MKNTESKWEWHCKNISLRR